MIIQLEYCRRQKALTEGYGSQIAQKGYSQAEFASCDA